MNIYSVYDLVNYIAGKFPSGGAFTPERFNQLLPLAQNEFLEKSLGELIAAESNEELYAKIYNSSPLVSFYKTDTLSVDLAGNTPLPADFLWYRTVLTEADYSGTTGTKRFRKVDIVDSTTFAEKQGDVMSRPRVKPFCRIGSGRISVVPFDVSEITLKYIGTPNAPYMDVCQNADSPTQVIFMPAGSYIEVVPNEQTSINVLYDSGGNVLFSGVYKSTMTSSHYNSLTVELGWDPVWWHHLVYIVLQKAGVNLSDQLIAQYALEKEKN